MCVCVCVYVFVCEKLTALMSLQSFPRYRRNVNLLLKRNTHRNRPKMVKESKRGIKSISARVTKHVSEKVAKAEVNLNYSLWIDYNNWLWIVLILNYILRRFSLFYINFLTGYMIYSIFCSIFSKSTKSMKPNGYVSTKWTTVLYFVWEKVLFYTKVKVCLL